LSQSMRDLIPLQEIMREISIKVFKEEFTPLEIDVQEISSTDQLAYQFRITLRQEKFKNHG